MATISNLSNPTIRLKPMLLWKYCAWLSRTLESGAMQMMIQVLWSLLSVAGGGSSSS
jgi:hypothetical protein